jgi:hypothetical protein
MPIKDIKTEESSTIRYNPMINYSEFVVIPKLLKFLRQEMLTLVTHEFDEQFTYYKDAIFDPHQITKDSILGKYDAVDFFPAEGTS